MGNRGESIGWSERGVSIVELAFILPILVVLVFGIVDMGRLIQARLVVTNVSREGGSLASRTDPDLDVRDQIDKIVNMLLSSAAPLDLRNADGNIYVTRINAGENKDDPEPYISIRSTGGSLGANSSISGNEGSTPSGLPKKLYDHLRFQKASEAADILNVTVVEVFYYYKPITPLPKLIKELLLPNNDGILIGSRSYF